MARKTKKDALATRESVLLAALDLFGEKGYSRTTLSDIAKRIGMTRGAVYWHFDNKPALLVALIEYVHVRREQMTGMRVPDILMLDDLRRAFIAHARNVVEDSITRKFEFFMNFQMEWSEELLTETHKQLNEIRQSPLAEFKRCFQIPAIAERLRPGVDLDQLIVTLASFWMGLCKMYLGRCPGLDFGHRTESNPELLGGFDLIHTVAAGFDLIMSAVLTEEN
ncbi:MAG: TetR family transcriptional regulator [Kiritimatiellales bacterium]|nr:TetR family transcriptional regulator [Kiritimatiellales bacterium]